MYRETDLEYLCNVCVDNSTNDKSDEMLVSTTSQLYIWLSVDSAEVRIYADEILMLLKTVSSQSRPKRKRCSICVDVLAKLTYSMVKQETEVQSSESDVYSLHQLKTIGCIKERLSLCVGYLANNRKFENSVGVAQFLLAVTVLHYENTIPVGSLDIRQHIHQWLLRALPSTPSMTLSCDTLSIVSQDDMPSFSDTPHPQRMFTTKHQSRHYDTKLIAIYTIYELCHWLRNDDAQSLVRHAVITMAIKYSLHLIDLSENTQKISSDQVTQNTCLTLSLSVLDRLCHIDPSRVPQIFTEVKRFYARLSTKQLSHARLILEVTKFFVNHGAAVMYDMSVSLSLYFGDVLSLFYYDPIIASETITFILTNQSLQSNHADILIRYSPNILKIISWHPQSCLSEFLDILHLTISPQSSIEVFHSILDLPCVCACMELCQRPMSDYPQSVSLPLPRSVNEFRNPANQLAYKFIMRSESGHGDTINKLGIIHNQLEDMNDNPRVLACSQTIPLLLQKYFNIILEEGDSDLTQSLLPVILERSGILYNIPSYRHDVKCLLFDNLIHFFSKYPHLVSATSSDILDYFNGIRLVPDKEHIFTVLVWAVGEFCTATSGPELLTNYYETLETLTYEISAMVARNAHEFDPRVISALMSSLAKLASRSQDLIARVMLCLTKVSQQQKHGGLQKMVKNIIITRSQELVSLLHFPNLACVILSPPDDINMGRLHRDPLAENVVLRVANNIITSRGS